jgi:hypothetical protein
VLPPDELLDELAPEELLPDELLPEELPLDTPPPELLEVLLPDMLPPEEPLPEELPPEELVLDELPRETLPPELLEGLLPDELPLEELAPEELAPEELLSGGSVLALMEDAAEEPLLEPLPHAASVMSTRHSARPANKRSCITGCPRRCSRGARPSSLKPCGSAAVFRPAAHDYIESIGNTVTSSKS